jgi:hypothetical protein
MFRSELVAMTCSYDDPTGCIELSLSRSHINAKVTNGIQNLVIGDLFVRVDITFCDVTIHGIKGYPRKAARRADIPQVHVKAIHGSEDRHLKWRRRIA